MKQYVLDELRPDDFIKLQSYFERNWIKSSLANLYKIELEHELLSDKQKFHSKCAPFYFSIELRQNRLCCELLVRSSNKIKCGCIKYASLEQVNWIIMTIDTILDKLKIIS